MSTLRHTVWLSGSAKDPPTENVHIFSVRQEEREKVVVREDRRDT